MMKNKFSFSVKSLVNSTPFRNLLLFLVSFLMTAFFSVCIVNHRFTLFFFEGTEHSYLCSFALVCVFLMLRKIREIFTVKIGKLEFFSILFFLYFSVYFPVQASFMVTIVLI